MARKLIIVGNGLGMAIDPSHFSLSHALADIWDRAGVLTQTQKQLIENCLKRPGPPQGEHELSTLHQVIVHCSGLNQIAGGGAHWLTPEGQSFPEVTAKYIHKVATKLHNYSGALPTAFEDALVDFVKKTKSHVATLNYDKLLYTSFINNDVVAGYDGALVDGMVNGGFEPDRLERRYGRTFGYYLHLHGSPLFVERNSIVTKLSRDSLTLATDEPSKHIVLTHVKHKPSVIDASPVLSAYWAYLHFALSDEIEEIILFGYSGLDDHLNLLLRPYRRSIPAHVIEWDGAGTQQEREDFWKKELGSPARLTVTRLPNITQFTQW